MAETELTRDIASLMTHAVEVIAPEAPLQVAAQRMRALNVGSLPVCNGRRLVGMLTDRDITLRAVAEGLDAAATPVSAVMTPEVVVARADQSIAEAAHLMSAHQIRRLPIVDAAGDLVGILALGDLAVDSAGTLSDEVLTDVSQPARGAGQ